MIIKIIFRGKYLLYCLENIRHIAWKCFFKLSTAENKKIITCKMFARLPDNR